MLLDLFFIGNLRVGELLFFFKRILAQSLTALYHSCCSGDKPELAAISSISQQTDTVSRKLWSNVKRKTAEILHRAVDWFILWLGHHSRSSFFPLRHRLLKVPLPSVCEVKPLPLVLHCIRSDDIHLQLLERWDFRITFFSQILKSSNFFFFPGFSDFKIINEQFDIVFAFHLSADPHHRDLYLNSSDYLALLNSERPNPNSTGQKKNTSIHLWVMCLSHDSLSQVWRQ